MKQIAQSLVCVVLGASSASLYAKPATQWYGLLAYSESLVTADSLKTALTNGADVNATVDLSKCERQGGGEPSTTKGGLSVTPFRIQANGTLSFSDSHYTVSTRSGSPVPLMQYLRYVVEPEGGITVTSFMHSIPDYTLVSQVAFDCTINEGVNFYTPF